MENIVLTSQMSRRGSRNKYLTYHLVRDRNKSLFDRTGAFAGV